MRVLLALVLLCSISTQAQHLHHLDFAELYAQNKVEYMYVFAHNCTNGLPTDSCLTTTLRFDQQGRLVESTDHFACGRVFSVQGYVYDQNGTLASSWVKHRSKGMQELAFLHECDAQGRLVERRLSSALPNFWQKETLSRRSDGSIATIQQTRETVQGTDIMWEQDYSPPQEVLKKRSENTLTDVYSLEGLHLLHHRIQNRTVVHITSFHYDRY